MSLLKKILRGKCPGCGDTSIFNTSGNPLIFRMPVMHQKCKKCQYNFVKEPGYFIGAMYVSYALTAAEMIAILLTTGFVFNLHPLYMFIWVVIAALLLSTFNFRMSRILWIYFFKDPKTGGQQN